MHTLFLLNPAAGKADCTRTLPQQIAAAAAGAGLAPEDYTIRVTTHAGHARELSRAAAAAAQKAGVELHIFTAGGDGTFNEALTGAHGFDKTAVGCLPYGSGNRLPTASRSSGASRCAAARQPMRCPLSSSCAGISAAGWSTSLTARC